MACRRRADALGVGLALLLASGAKCRHRVQETIPVLGCVRLITAHGDLLYRPPSAQFSIKKSDGISPICLGLGNSPATE